MVKTARPLMTLIAVVLVFGLAARAVPARADLLDDLLKQSDKNSTKTKTGSKSGSSTTTSSTASATTTGTGVAAPAVIPAATPLILASYATDPENLESGSKFALTLTVKNPGSDSAEDVVVQIGATSTTPATDSSALVVLGSGSAQYIGAIDAGQSNSNASFQILANPAAPGGARSVPVTLTWKSQGYEHTASESVGILVSTAVALDTSLTPPARQGINVPFATLAEVHNSGTKKVRGVQIQFSGSGAVPSDATTIPVGDLEPGETRSVEMKYVASLVGRAKLAATVSYVDDFGTVRTVPITGWAHVQRTLPKTPSDSDRLASRVLAFIAALLGVNG